MTGACELGCIEADLPPGPAWIFVATINWENLAYPCVGSYVLTADGLYCIVPVEPTSWGRIKAGYRE